MHELTSTTLWESPSWPCPAWPGGQEPPGRRILTRVPVSIVPGKPNDVAKKKAAKKRAEKSARASTTKKRIESYSHADKQRVNNPPVGLVTPDTDPVEEPRNTYAYDPHLDPQLVWAGKAERTSFEIPTVSLHVHE